MTENTQHQQQAEPEAGHRDADQRGEAGDAVGQADAPGAGVEAERNADQQREHGGGEGELDGGGQALGDDVDDRAVVEEAAAEIAVQGAPEERGEAVGERAGRGPFRGAVAATCCGRDALVAEHDLHRVARGRPHHGEDGEAGAEQHGEQVGEAWRLSHIS